MGPSYSQINYLKKSLLALKKSTPFFVTGKEFKLNVEGRRRKIIMQRTSNALKYLKGHYLNLLQLMTLGVSRLGRERHDHSRGCLEIGERRRKSLKGACSGSDK